ncbi:hypothetical protein CYY_002121 [Polysphondylium violaceum]|uniref:Uncharacterized protein n=1 Tax=Polysphondylium violaceum TaxID=133409 RepID=A0A8J4PZP4_9MYCE|nr:hypothetical protein CYY_002121 [Polysphondylium violaceum]
MSQEQILHLTQLIQNNDIGSLRSFFISNKKGQLPISLITPLVQNGNIEMLKIFFANRSFRCMVDEIDFPALVDSILDQYNKQLFEIVMKHFRPHLYRYLESARPIVDPYIFYLALKTRYFTTIKMSLKKMGLSYLHTESSLKKYKKVVSFVTTQFDFKKEDIQLITKDGRFYIIIFKNWNVVRFSIEDGNL